MWHRDAPRLDGGWEKKQILAPHFRTQNILGVNAPYWKKKLATLLGLFGAQQWIGAGVLCPLALLVTPLVWHFATKCAAVKFSEPWTWNHFSELRYHSYFNSATYPECPTKYWRDKSCWLSPRQSESEVVQGLDGVTTSPTLLGHVLVWSQQNYQRLLLTERYSKSS